MLSSAEVCARALAGQVGKEATNPDEWKTYRRDYKGACAQVDLAMNLPPGDPAAEDHFDDARVFIDRALDDPAVSPETTLEATMLDVYLPAFAAAQNKKPLSKRHQVALRRGLGNLVEIVEELPMHPAEKRGLRNKMVIPMALARSTELFLPALSREAHTRSPQFAHHNNDGSVYVDGQRVPIKSRGSARREGEYSEEILYLPLIQLVSDACTPEVSRSVKGTVLVDKVIGLLHQEATGDPVDLESATWLNALTKSIIYYARDFAAETPQQS
jgi:hypothetical protein